MTLLPIPTTVTVTEVLCNGKISLQISFVAEALSTEWLRVASSERERRRGSDVNVNVGAQLVRARAAVRYGTAHSHMSERRAGARLRELNFKVALSQGHVDACLEGFLQFGRLYFTSLLYYYVPGPRGKNSQPI